MSKNNKVLTVSYGVFSCKLEGFDDSLETMKTVAAYFRDLAAEDRCFGAEPGQRPSPSAPQQPQHRGLATDPLRDDPEGTATGAPPDGGETEARFFGQATPEDHAGGAPEFDDTWVRPQDEDESAVVPAASEGLTERLHRLRLAAARQDAPALDQAYDEDLEEPGHSHGFTDPDALAPRPASADDKRQALHNAVTEISEALNADDADQPPQAQSDEIKGAPDRPAHPSQPQRTAQGPAPVDQAGHPEPDRRNASVPHSDPADPETTPAKRPATGENQSPIDGARDKDLSRLMAEADHQMQEPEGKTRRSAFAHLRAAVATRFADRSIEDSRATVERKAVESFRSDLADAVRPARAKVPATMPNRPSDARVAPLKLVAEQRIGVDEMAETSRRPSLQWSKSPSEDADFDIYAKARGAAELPGRLEAAAAYLAFVKGYEDFSRPQLMSCMKTGDAAAFDREAELKAFGQLLIAGKIKRVAGDRFVASDSIGYKPGQRATG